MLYGTLVGNVGGEPELRYAPSGEPVLRFNVASNYRKRNAEGEWADRVEWVRVIVFGNRAGSIAEHGLIQKGTKVTILGNIEADAWTDNEGTARSGLQMLAREVEIMSPRDGNSGGGSSKGWGNDMTGAPSGKARQPAGAGAAKRGAHEEEEPLEDLPF